MKSKIAHILIILCFAQVYAKAQFKDINTNSGISHSHVSPDLLGGGVGIIDVNNDGLEDIYLTGGSKADKLYLNRGDLQFEDISTESFIFQSTRLISTTAVTIGDINNDGYDDIFLTTQKGYSPILLLNSGHGTFEEISNKAGLKSLMDWGMGAAMFDVNKDGFLDIYVINYISEFNPILNNENELIGYDHYCSENYLLINNQDNTFTNKATEYHLGSRGCSLSVGIMDINSDGYEDILVANDFGEWILPNEAYIFDPEKNVFKDEAQAFNLQDSVYAMGIGIGDYNNDNIPDYYITNIGSNSLRSSTNSRNYIDLAETMNVQNTKVDELNSTGWGTIFLDIDNDSYEDLYVANGYIGAAHFLKTSEQDPNKLFKNNTQTFDDISDISTTGNPAKSRGVVTADLNNDGFPEIICINIEPIRYKKESNTNIYENLNSSNNWLSISLEGTAINKNAIGSSVTIFFQERQIKKHMYSGGSHASSSTKRLQFGIGNAIEIDSISVIWSDHSMQGFSYPPINKFLKITQGNDNYIIQSCEETNWGCNIEDPLSVVKNNFTLFPSPADKTVTFNFRDTNIHNFKIYDLIGNQIQFGEVQNNQAINVSNITDGYYILCIGDQKSRLIIKHQ